MAGDPRPDDEPTLKRSSEAPTGESAVPPDADAIAPAPPDADGGTDVRQPTPQPTVEASRRTWAPTPSDVAAVIGAAPRQAPPQRSRVVWIVIAAVAFLAVAAVLFSHFLPNAAEPPPARPDPWTPLAGRLDLSALGDDVRCEIDGKRVAPGASLAPGSYTLHVEREGDEAQDIPFTVRAGETTRPTPGRWVQRVDVKRLVADLAIWKAASTAARLAAAEFVDAKTRDFRLLRLETFSCGGQSFEVAIYAHDATGLEFVLVPAGPFQMGSPESESGHQSDEKLHAVTLARPFLIARTECTQAEYEKVTGSNPSTRNKGPAFPVETVSWDEAKAFCDKAGLVLPTEAQWEYACRAGTAGRFCGGESDAVLGDFAWYAANSGSTTRAVREKKPNAFGLYDLHGNVWEWCEDVYVDSYDGAPKDGSARESGGTYRVYRGGSWLNTAGFARSAIRNRYVPGFRFVILGFRPARLVATE